MSSSPQPDQQASSPSSQPRLTVIGIGASAGGLPALRAFFTALPVDTGLTFVVVVHLSPEHESLLATLLQPYTAMPVIQVTERVQMQPDHVYVIPPAKQLLVMDGTLTLTDFENTPHAAGKRPMQIDAFFRSLAENHGDGGAIILSGSGSDGAVGIQAIKEHGGLLLVQTPDEAEYEGMPRSAIATGLVDIVAPVAELATQLVAAKQMRNTIQLPVDGETLSATTQQTLIQILAQLRVRTGHDFSGYKQPTLLRRVARRMQLTQLTTLTAYLQWLRQDSTEAELLFRDLLINVTEFFRDREAWATLEATIIPQIFAGKGRDDSVRVWAVGCATGEEAYSLAMLLLEYAGELVAPPAVQVFASDLGQTALDFAREGCYPEAIAVDIPETRLVRFFTKDNSHYRVRPELREAILFTRHNLLQDPPFSRLDLIVCRNLLIYIQRDLQEKVFETFYYALRPQGFLFLGTAESAEGATDLFDTLDKRQRLYQRQTRDSATPVLPSLPLLPHAVRPPRLGSEPVRSPQPSPNTEHQRLLESVAPPSVLVDREYNVLHLSETAGRYLLPPGGAPTVDLLKLVRPELQAELQTALFRAFEENKAVSTRPAPVRFNGAPHLVYLMVRPHQPAGGAARALVIFLEDETPLPVESTAAGPDTLTAGARQQLEAELRHVQGRLQSMREEYETTVEELRAANEELQSTNEEYKSTLEELETSKEELQSINEELQTINQELKTKIEEVTHAHSDVQNLFIATDIATLFLDRDLRVKRYTPSAAALFNLMPPDKGRPIAHLRSNLLYTQLETDAQRVLAHLTPVEREIQSQDDRWFLVRVRPYRTLEDKIDGVVITFIDITANKANELALRDAKEYAESIVHTIPDALLVLDPNLRVQMTNDAFYEIFQASREATEGRLIYELGNGQWQIPALRTLLEDILPENKVFIGYEVEHTFEQIGRRTMLVNGRRLDHVQLILLAITDITERKRAEDRVRLAAEQDSFRVTLTNALRPLSDPLEIQYQAACVLGEYLDADRVGYAEDQADEETIHVTRNYTNGVPGIEGHYRYDDYGPELLREFKQGKTVVRADIANNPTLTPAEKAAHAALQLGATVNVPLLKAGKLVAVMFVHCQHAHDWSPDEVALIEETVERTWDAVERARAEAALRASEAKYRTLFDSIDEGFCIIEMIHDEAGANVDYRFLEVNRVFKRQTGLKEVMGRLGSELMPETEPYWLETYDRVVRTGESIRFENYHEVTARWYLAYASRVGGVGSRQVAIVFDDITERKRREANLAFLAELSTEFAPFAHADDLMRRVSEKLAQYLDLNRCDFSEVDEAADRITTLYDWRRDPDAPSVLGGHAISTFLTPAARAAYAAGTMSVVNDTHQDPKINAPAETMDALRIRAVVDSPYLEHGRWKFLISLCRSEVCVWRADEIDLIREVTERIYIRLQRAYTETALRESEGRLRVMIENLPGAVFIIDPALHCLLAEGQALHAVGFQAGAFVDQPIIAAFAPTVRDRYEAMFRQALAGEAFANEHDWEGRFYLSRGTPLRAADGEIYAALVVSYDITDRKQAEAALQQLNATLEQQVDTRTAQVRALASSLTMAEQEERRRISQILHDDLQQLLYGIQMRVMAIVTDIQQSKHDLLSDYAQEAYSWLDDAIQTTRQLTVDLSPPILKDEGLVDALHWLVPQMAVVNNLQVTLQVDQSCRIEDENMRVLLFQIVRELLFNVVKHAGVNAATVTLTAETDRCVIIVQDAGRSFDVAAAATKAERGFGLFSVNERLKLFGGGMEMQSTPGQGTRMTIYVPLSAAK